MKSSCENILFPLAIGAVTLASSTSYGLEFVVNHKLSAFFPPFGIVIGFIPISIAAFAGASAATAITYKAQQYAFQGSDEYKTLSEQSWSPAAAEGLKAGLLFSLAYANNFKLTPSSIADCAILTYAAHDLMHRSRN